MELHEESGSFIPDQHGAGPAPADDISPGRRLWRGPAIAGSTALVAALCLYTGTAAHASGPSAAKASALNLQPAAQAQTTTTQGGVHGAFCLYDGAGGGVEFWFNPSTGSLTVAVGTGVGPVGGGVLGDYAYGTAPTAGTYLYASATLTTGTVVTLNLAGSYQLVNGVFSGSVSATVEGRTLTISSDGSSTYKATVSIAPSSTGWVGPSVYYYDYNFYFWDVEQYVEIPTTWPEPDPDPYTIIDSDSGSNDTSVYSDVSGTDGSLVTSDGDSSDSGSVSSDDGSSDSGDSGDDASSGDDGGGGGGGGRSDDSTYPIEEE
ncbi:MAG TPA: hypothetical protein VGX23_10990 [Actinocrinis sp.]|nr:hypothetical protein [Actinocrinis sp.]